MYMMADVAPEMDEAPYRDDGAHSLWALFCVVFVFMGQLFIMQLFVSVIIDSFSIIEGSGLLTDQQSLVNDMTQYITQICPEPKPPVPEGFRVFFYHFFTTARPVAVSQMEECIRTGNIPQPRFIADIKSVKRQVEVTTKALIKMRVKSMDTDGDGQISLDEFLAAGGTAEHFAAIDTDGSGFIDEGEFGSEELVFDQGEQSKLEDVLQTLQRSAAAKMEAISVLERFSRESLLNQPLPDNWLHVCGDWFDAVLTVCILANIACMCTVHYNQSDMWSSFIFWQGFWFNAIFTVEMTVKIIGLGPVTYWTSPFDAFDGFVVLVSWLFVFVDAGSISSLFRIGRVFRLVKRAPKIQRLMSTLMRTLPSITNVFMVLLLVFFIFSVIGVELFGQVRYGNSLNTIANMGTWSAAMHSLWRCALGNWRALMYDTMVMGPDCTSGTSEDGSAYNDCGDYITACMFFVIFQVCATFCVMNLVVAIILNAFTWCYSLESPEITGEMGLNATHLQHFTNIWSRFDLFGTGFIDVRQLHSLMGVVQYNIRELCFQGTEFNQRDEQKFVDYASFGSGANGTDRDAPEATCRANFEELVRTIAVYEQSLDIQSRILDEGTDIMYGEDTNAFDDAVDNGVVVSVEGPAKVKLLKVRFSSLIRILIQKALGLDNHDIYVCHDYRDPFQVRWPGYQQGQHSAPKGELKKASVLPIESTIFTPNGLIDPMLETIPVGDNTIPVRAFNLRTIDPLCNNRRHCSELPPLQIFQDFQEEQP